MLKTFETQGGITVHRKRTTLPVESAMQEIYDHIDQAKGALFASDYEFPGRYSRWDIGFIDPPLEIISKQRELSVHALNPRGKVMLRMLQAVISENEH